MKKVYFTPGPSELYFTYQDHFRVAMNDQLGSINHRSKRFQEIFQFTSEQLTELLHLPGDFKLVFVTSATESWERITQNLISETSHHFVHGDFGEKFFKVSKAFGRNAEMTRIDDAPLPIATGAEVLGLTMNETSTGQQLTNDFIKEMKRLNPNSLLALDTVSAAPSHEIDFSLVDTAYFSVQKCFGMPPGLGVWMVNERALEKAKTINHPSYHSLPNLLKNGEKFQTPCTPNVVAIYLLGKIAKDMNRRGIQMIRNETNYKSALLYQTLEAHDGFELSITSKANRSRTVAVANCSDSSSVIDFFAEKGMVIGDGYGANKGKQIRIANFPAHSKEQVELLCDTLEKF